MVADVKTYETIPGRTERIDWASFAAKISKPKHAGKWCLFPTPMTSSYVTQIKTGSLKAFRPKGAFEASTRSREDGRLDLYVRYLGA